MASRVPSKDTIEERDRAVVLKNKTLEDSTTAFSDNGDPTKQLKFELSGITSGQTRVLTVPNASGNILLDTSAFLIGGNTVTATPVIGTNSNHPLYFETNGTNRFQMPNFTYSDTSPYGAAFNNSYGSGLYSLHPPTSPNWGWAFGGGINGPALILGPTGQSTNAGPLTIRGGYAFGGGNPGPIYIETSKSANGDGTANGFITLRTLGVKLSTAFTSGAINLLTGEAGFSSGEINIATGSAPTPDTVGFNTGNINISTGSTSSQLVGGSGSVGSISLSCGTANAPVGTLKNGGNITLQSSRGANGGADGDINLYTDATAAGLRVASVDGGRLSVLDSSQIGTVANDWARLQPRLRSRLLVVNSGNINGITVVSTPGTFVELAYPDLGYTAFRNKDFTVSGTVSQFTYNGPSNRWFDFNVSANYSKTGGGVAVISFQLFVNGSAVGFPFKIQGTNDLNSVTGTGQLLLNNGDVISPRLTATTVENITITDISFNVVEDQDNFVAVDVANLGAW